MAPNTSSVFNKAPPQPQQPESKASDAGVLVVAPPQSIEPPSSVPACDVLSVASSSAAASLTSIATASAAATGVPTSQASAAALANALRTDECSSTTTGCLRRRRRHADRFSDVDDAATASADASADEDAAALAASERHFQQQLQMSRFARVSPAALDGLKPFRKSCLKRSSSELPADLSALKHEAAAAAAAHRALVTSPPAPLRPVQKNRRRCWECKAKVALTAVTCRCDYTFCNKHRYAEEHKCSFDFKVSAKRQLESENPRVVPSKVARIN